jgi:hypothetical protein
MLSRVALATRSLARPAAARFAAPSAVRCYTVENAMTADDALQLSGYNSIDYTIKDNATVFDAVHKFAAFNIGCLVTVDDGKLY